MSLNSSEAHQRYNPLRKSWVLCSPHRTQRPWQGQQEGPQVDKRPQYDETCYLCPGNKRAQGQANPKYENTFVFPNDFAAVKPLSDLGEPAPSSQVQGDELFQAQQATGRCVVICFSPRHDLTLAQMSPTEIHNVISAWKDVYNGACEDNEIAYCQIFENKGSAMGCSNPHPHGQAWMTSIIPEEPAIEHKCLQEYEDTHNGRGLLEDYVVQELERSQKDAAQNRLIDENSSFIAVVPYWATWPFEVMVVSKRKIGNVCELSEQEQADFAEILKKVAVRYDNLFECSFPYSMGLHQLPANATRGPEHLHVHFYPPLLRSATVKKFLVGFEMLGMPQRDITPEQAAARLRDCDASVHYLDKIKN